MAIEGARHGSILVVGGTHGNERNAPWLLEQWARNPASLKDCGFQLQLVQGNPAALAAGKRYLDRDLNRCFDPHLLDSDRAQGLEVDRARELLQRHGPAGLQPTLVAIDLHSTTASMGNSLVLYGRRPADLALAAGVQRRLGLPVYLHEGDATQTGFLVECWPCGLVVEVGPVPQGVVQARICEQTQLALEAIVAVLSEAAGVDVQPLPWADQLVVFRHLGSVDLPRHGDGTPAACLHPSLHGRDWQPLALTDPVFLGLDGRTITLAQCLDARLAAQTPLWPVFINEAAYGEKGIAFSLTHREVWPVSGDWHGALRELAQGLQRGDPL